MAISVLFKELALVGVLTIAGGEDSGGAESVPEKEPEVAATFSFQVASYSGDGVYGANATRSIEVVNAPADSDFFRYAMLHDGSTSRLYVFKRETTDTLYQFAFDKISHKFVYDFKSSRELKLVNVPEDANTNSFVMLHDGAINRLYMQRFGDKTTIYQFGYNTSSGDYEHGYESTPQLSITAAPDDADLDRWAMLHDGSGYRLYTGKIGKPSAMYQYSFNGSSYEWGYQSIARLVVNLKSQDSVNSNFSMLHDGYSYHYFYPKRR